MFSYTGGKKYFTKKLDVYFPKQSEDNNTTFVDVFGGAGWVVSRSRVSMVCKKRVYNDYNIMLANIYHCFVFKYDELLSVLKTYKNSDEQLFLTLQDKIFNKLDWSKVQLGDSALAAEYLYLNQQHFSNEQLNGKILPYFHELRTDNGVNKYLSLIKRMEEPDTRKTLTNITGVENLDCIDVINKYDSPDTLFYVDPPYFNLEHYYTKEFPFQKHKELADRLATIHGKFVLSYYEHEDMHIFYPQDKFIWQIEKVKKVSSNKSKYKIVDEDGLEIKHEADIAEEIIIMNYQPMFTWDIN